MRSLLARLAVLGAFAVSISACGGGNGTSLPFAGAPNGAGGVSGTFQSGSNGQMLLRFIQGSPDLFSFFGGPPASGTVDVCLDNQPLGLTGGVANYGARATGGASNGALFLVTGGGITHTITVYPAQVPAQAGVECATAPGPYLGVTQIAVATLATPAGSNIRWTVVLGGTKASGTLGLYVFGEPTWFFQPTGNAVISHNAAPAFTKALPAPPPAKGVGFGFCTTTVTPCAVATALTGAGNIAAPNPTGIGPATVVNGNVNSGINTIPAGFYDGIGVAAGTPVPITSVAAPNAASGNPYVVMQYAIDGPAGGLNLATFLETTVGFGF
jgi:hypothetical protein